MAAADNVGKIIYIGFCIHNAVSFYWSELGFVRTNSPTMSVSTNTETLSTLCLVYTADICIDFLVIVELREVCKLLMS